MNNLRYVEKAVIERKVMKMYVMEKLGAPTIAKELGISKTQVYRILKRNNIERRQRKSIIGQAIMQLYKKQMSIAELSEHFGLKEKTIEIIIRQNKNDV